MIVRLQVFENVGLLLLASGRSQRFGFDDKLLADYRGQALIQYAASLLKDETLGARTAVVRTGAGDVSTILKDMGWDVVVNDSPSEGMSRSIRLGIEAIETDSLSGVITCLGDMPNVTDDVLHELATKGVRCDAVMCECRGVMMPPAWFAASAFSNLKALTGDKGARKLFGTLSNTACVGISPEIGLDIDVRSDL